jgi:hypothetical protein
MGDRSFGQQSGFLFQSAFLRAQGETYHEKNNRCRDKENHDQQEKNRPTDSIAAAEGTIRLACHTGEHVHRKLENDVGGFFPEVDRVDGHQQQTGRAAPSDDFRGSGGIGRPHKRPQHEEQAHQKGERDENDVERFEGHGEANGSLEGQTEIESVEVDRIAFCGHNQYDHKGKKYQRSEENPVNGLLFMIQVHENITNQSSFERCDQKTENHIPNIKPVHSDVESGDSGNGNSDAGKNE